MSMNKYKIKGTGELFDGLIVLTHDNVSELTAIELVCVERLQSTSKLFETWSLPVSGIYIEAGNLVECVEQTDDQLTDNPFGEYVAEGTLSKGDVTVRWARYENALTVSIVEPNNTLYSHSFFGPKAWDVKEFLDETPEDSSYDWDNLVFDIQELE